MKVGKAVHLGPTQEAVVLGFSTSQLHARPPIRLVLPTSRPMHAAGAGATNLHHPQHEKHVGRELLDAHFLDGRVWVERVHPVRGTSVKGARDGLQADVASTPACHAGLGCERAQSAPGRAVSREPRKLATAAFPRTEPHLPRVSNML